MPTRESNPFISEVYLGQAAESLFLARTVLQGEPEPCGSRRRRLWELAPTAQCPVVGICLPMAWVRKFVTRQMGPGSPSTDYELHCALVVACKSRTALSKQVQDELDRRYAVALRTVASIKTREALVQHWRSHENQSGYAGLFWSVLTHPRCDAELEFLVLGHAHMLQHQAGCERHDREETLKASQKTLDELSQRLRVLTERYQAVQAELAAAHAAHQKVVASLQAELAAVQPGPSVLPSVDAQAWVNERQAMARDMERLQRRLSAMRGECDQKLHERDRIILSLQARLDAASDMACAAESRMAPCPPELANRCILCVGGRPSAVPQYRAVVEQQGGRFLHHDGGQEEGLAVLDARLSSADVVICQAGCVSHEAYFRVKDHCKRRGVPCLYLSKSSTTALVRALQQVTPSSQ